MADLPNTTVTGTGAQPAPVEIAKVAVEFTKVFDAILTVDTARNEARELANSEATTATNTRLSALVSLASAAATGHWSAYDVEQGLEKSLSRRNAVDASIKTFASEIKRACHAKARGHVADYVMLAAEAWAAEAEFAKANKKAETPCRKAFARQYHLVQRMLGEAVDGGRDFANAADVRDYAVANDPDLDFAKVFKRLRAIRAQIAGFASDFPVPGFAEVIEYIDRIEKDELKASREPAGTDEGEGDTAEQVHREDAADTMPVALADAISDALADIAA
jgi:hypothetical protein